MVVDFVMNRASRIRVAFIVRVGPWKEDNLRAEFGELVAWAKSRNVRTGRWIFVEGGRHRWEACLEIVGQAAPGGRVRLKHLLASPVASVTFDPNRLSSRVVYHGLNDWTRSAKRDGRIKSVTAIREVYSGDPWKNRAAWTSCEVQFLLRK